MRTLGDLKILLAEDNEIFQRIAAWTFKKIGMTCDMAANGKEAFEMHQKNTYDLILMDLQMPVMDGYESTRMIRNFERQAKATNPVIVVALTANDVTDKKDLCLECGMNDFMEKPFQVEKLRVLINDLFSISI